MRCSFIVVGLRCEWFLNVSLSSHLIMSSGFFCLRILMYKAFCVKLIWGKQTKECVIYGICVLNIFSY